MTNPYAARDAALRDLRERLAALREASAAKLREVADLKLDEQDVIGQIRDLCGDREGTLATSDGAPMFSVTYSRRFDANTASTALPSDLLASVSETVVSASKAKRILPPALYELCQKRSDIPTIKPKD